MKNLNILTSSIEDEISLLKTTLERILSQANKAKSTHDEDYWHAVSANLVSFYTGVENIFKLIANNIDGYVPQGSDWHIQLLRQMQKPNEMRCRVIQESTLSLIGEYRAFRHLFMNNYAIRLDSSKLEALVNKLPQVYQNIYQDLMEFTVFLTNLNQQLQMSSKLVL